MFFALISGISPLNRCAFLRGLVFEFSFCSVKIGVGVEPTRGNLLLVLERRSNTGPGFRLMVDVDVDVDAVRVERSAATCSSKYYFCSSKYYYSPLISCVLRLI